MDITYNVTLTEIRHTSPVYKVPTIEIRGRTEDRHAIMAAAHRMAAALWDNNPKGHDIEITLPHNGLATVTIDVGRDGDAQETALAYMRTIVPAAPAPKGKVKPAAQLQA